MIKSKRWNQPKNHILCGENIELEKEQNEEPANYEFIQDEKLFLITLYGDLDEEKAENTINELYSIKEYCRQMWEEWNDREEEEEVEEEEEYEKPVVHLILSTFGGSVHDMFSIYDCMQKLKQYCDISVVGLGKVQSAGVALLCAGTKGLRLLGPHCRLMLHPVMFQSFGTVDDVSIEHKETKVMSDLYEKILVENTNMTKRQARKYIKKDKNYYFDSEKAIEFGIADRLF